MMKTFLRIELFGKQAEDGRIYVNSPDLEGFHFILEPDEDPFEVMLPTLSEFMRLYIEAEVRSFAPAPTPKQYRQQQMNIPATMFASRDYSMVAEVA